MMKDELEPGDYVTPTVRLVRPLAEGGMGKVWIAEHLVLDTRVVVKIMAKQLGGLAEATARFAREAAVAAAVKSPHVVQVFDSGLTEDGIPYIVMELLEGHDLGAQLTARGRMAPAEVVAIVTQLAKALARAHRVGVIHRDIKPDNVFLCDVEGGEPFVKLLDFGTAKDEARAPFTTTAGQLLGTPYYMSPEQILGEDVDARADIWSLGVLAFEALTGKRPFEGVTVGAITLAIHTTSPRMTDIVPELPPALDAWFAQVCARAPAERFQNARAAGIAFARAVTGDAEEDIPESTAEMPAIPASSSSVLDRAGTPSTPSGRVATSLSSTLSSTLSSPATERRTMTWIAGGVGLATLAAMFALLTHDEARPTTTTNGSVGSATSVGSEPSVAAATSLASATSVASAPSGGRAPSGSPSASGTLASLSPAPAGSGTRPAAPSSASDATKPAPAPAAATSAAVLPFPAVAGSALPPLPRAKPSASAAGTAPGATSASAAPASTVAPRASAPAGTQAPASASGHAPATATGTAPALPPASASASSPDPLPTAPLDLHDLLPPQ